MSRVKTFLQGWIITTLAVLVATKVVKGIHYTDWTDVLVATLMLGFLNAFVRPIMMFLSLPLLILTLGLFTLVINALLLKLVSYLLEPRFYLDPGFKAAFLGALVISLTTLVLNSLTGTGKSRVRVQRRQAPPPPKDDGGPIIDV